MSGRISALPRVLRTISTIAAAASTVVLGASTSTGRDGSARVPLAGARPLRLHGTVEPVRSHPVTAPRLTGTNVGQLVIVRLARPGSLVRRGELLVEFDRQAQSKAARDRRAEYEDVVAQIDKKRAEQLTARAHDEAELQQAENAVKRAELDMLGNELVAKIVAEKNALALEEARAKLAQLRKTFDLKRRSEAADLRILEIQRDRAQNAWRHADENADRMRIVSPIDGLVVLKPTWKSGTMGEVQEGEEVRSGLPLLDVVDASAMRVRARVNQADIERVRVGLPARITLDSYPSRSFEGRLEQLSPVGATSTLSNRVRTFVALFSIDGTDPHLVPDLAAAVDVAPEDRMAARRP
jgi:HlyD family secretion protein